MEPKKANDPDELGGWRINGRLGEGGFGTVFLAEKGAQKAAIKVIKQEFVEEEDARNRLATEAEVLSKLSDPSIGKILDSDLNGDSPWIATEFINGPTLDQKVKYEGPLEEIAWFNLAANLFHAIVTANQHGIIHKDIKPSNIILGETGNKLIDFGIAHISGQTRTFTFGEIEGSTPFSSPEHFTIHSNPKMDVFSAAATLAFAAKGSSIWNGQNDLQLMRNINQDSPNLEGMTENQAKFLTPLLEKNPSDRPSPQDALDSAISYLEFLIGKNKRPIPLKGRRLSKRVIYSKKTYALLGFVLTIFLGFQVIDAKLSNNIEDSIAKQCITSVRNGTLDLGIETCTKSLDKGNIDSGLYLARALRAKKSYAQAKMVLQNCKSVNVACASDYSYFYEKGQKLLDSLKLAHSKGDMDAAWRIGAYYQKNKDFDLAVNWYNKGSKNGSALANLLLATYYNAEKKQYKKAIYHAKLAVDGDLTGNPNLLLIDHPVERLIESLFVLNNEVNQKIEYFSKCANSKVVFCISTLAETYLSNKDFVNAKKWGEVGAELQDPGSMWVLAKVEAQKNTLLPKGTVNPETDKNIFYWYKKAGNLGHVKSTLALGYGYAFGMGSLKVDFKQSCVWFQKTMSSITERKGTYMEAASDIQDYKSASQFFELQACQTVLLGDTPPIRFQSSSPKPSASSSPSNSNFPPSPAPSSTGVSYSEELSSDLKSTSIFGRAFLSDSNWLIPLTNSADEAVPPINRVQFQDESLPYSSWQNVPYVLRNSGATGWQVVVSDLTLQFLFGAGNQGRICPKFRFALVQNNKVTYIWNKSVEPCKN